jgi:hypothetical protein
MCGDFSVPTQTFSDPDLLTLPDNVWWFLCSDTNIFGSGSIDTAGQCVVISLFRHKNFRIRIHWQCRTMCGDFSVPTQKFSDPAPLTLAGNVWWFLCSNTNIFGSGSIDTAGQCVVISLFWNTSFRIRNHWNWPGWHVECLSLPEELPGPEGLDALLLKQTLHAVHVRLYANRISGHTRAGIHRANYADFMCDLQICYSQSRFYIGFTHK